MIRVRITICGMARAKAGRMSAQPGDQPLIPGAETACCKPAKCQRKQMDHHDRQPEVGNGNADLAIMLIILSEGGPDDAARTARIGASSRTRPSAITASGSDTVSRSSTVSMTGVRYVYEILNRRATSHRSS